MGDGQSAMRVYQRFCSSYALPIAHSGFGALVPEQPALDLDRVAAAAVHEAADAVGGEHAVARNKDGDAVRAARAADRARRGAQPPRDIRIAQGLAWGYRVDRAPHAALEVGAAEIERQVERIGRIVEIPLELPAHALGEAIDRRQRGRAPE